MALPRSDYDTALSVHRWGKNEKDSHFDFVHKLYRFQVQHHIQLACVTS